MSDSAFTYGPELLDFDLRAYLTRNAPALAPYSDFISHWSGYYSISPKVLLAIIEMRSGALSKSVGRAPLNDPFAGLVERAGFEEQVEAVLRKLYDGFYAFRAATAPASATSPANTATFALLNLLRQDVPVDVFAGEVDSLRGDFTDAYGRLFAEDVNADAEKVNAGAVGGATPAAEFLQLPFTNGLSWRFNGVHTTTGDDPGVMSSIDFSRNWPSWGADTSTDYVVAAHAGTVTVFSSCSVRVTSPSGWATSYYHLDRLVVSSGQTVTANQTIGVYANNLNQALCQGGHSTGPHVHFSLLFNGVYSPLDDVSLSGYVVHSGRFSYDSDPAYMWLAKGGIRYSVGAVVTSEPTGSATKATMVTPAPGSQLTGASVTFRWDPGFFATAYWLDVGTVQGSGNLFGKNVGTATTQTVTTIPVTGGTVYVRLWSLIGAEWQFNDYTFTAPAKAVLTAPLKGSTLCSATATFRWSAGMGAQQYWLDVGTSLGSGNIYGANQALSTSRTVTGIPTNGTVFVRLWTLFGDGQTAPFNWLLTDYSYTATSCTKATMFTPAGGTTLTGSGIIFAWNTGVGASAYWLDVGTGFGQGNIFAQRLGLQTQQFVPGIPSNGSQVFVRLWSLLDDAWQVSDYTYTASGASTKATIVSPAGPSLAGPLATFRWNAGAGATEYWLDVGTAIGQGNLFGRNVGLATSQSVSGLPVSGGTVFVRLWTKSALGVWQFSDYSYVPSFLGKAILDSPIPGSILTGNSVTFSWNAASNATAYWLDVGSGPGVGDVFGKNVGTATSAMVGGLPTDGSFTYARLWTQVSGAWQFTDYTFVAGSAPSKAVLTSPVPGVMLTSATATFSWNAGAGAAAYWLDVGSAPGTGNYFGADVGLATGRTVTNLPINGSPVYVRLWTKLNGAWQFNDYSFTALH